MTVNVTIHNFISNARNRQARDGANFAYSEAVRLLKTTEGKRLRLDIHDFNRLCADDNYARQLLANCDCVVSNVGPHAYIYFYLREKFGLNFRIIRDVRTALWNAYLLQEMLVAHYLRPDDTVIHSSAYSRDLYKKIFPHFSQRSAFICYPLMHWFPARNRRSERSGQTTRRLVTIGFVGRLTDDKNFGQALDLLIALERHAAGRFRLRAIGEVLVSHYDVDSVQKRLRTALNRTPPYEWRAPVKQDKIWHEYDQLDVLFFPSTSNLETFGRVLIEASYWGLPIYASSHAAAPELLDSAALLPTQYTYDRTFNTHFAHPLGSIDIDEAARRLIECHFHPESDGYLRYAEHDKLYLAILCEGNTLNDGRLNSPATDRTNLIDSVHMQNFKLPTDLAHADVLCARLRRMLLRLQSFGTVPYYSSLVHLFAISHYRAKTLEFIWRSLHLREDFTNIGGIDLQMANELRFHPEFTLESMPRA